MGIFCYKSITIYILPQPNPPTFLSLHNSTSASTTSTFIPKQKGNNIISFGGIIGMQQTQTASQNMFLSPLLGPLQDTLYLSPLPDNFPKPSDELDRLLCQFTLHIEPSPENSQPHPDKELDCLKFQEPASDLFPQQEVPSTRFLEIHEEIQPPYLELALQNNAQSPVRLMLEHLLRRSTLPLSFTYQNVTLGQIYQLLDKKFKVLKKTKEELTKYIMRRAFKFIADRSNQQTSTHSRDLDAWMHQYFSQDAPNHHFSIPFKKHSVDKTMNGHFLKRVFDCPQFAIDYSNFLEEFAGLVAEDNQRKVDYLKEAVEQALARGEPETVDKIKRLPWTKDILKQVIDLAHALPREAQEGMGRRNRRQHE